MNVLVECDCRHVYKLNVSALSMVRFGEAESDDEGAGYPRK